MAPPSFKSILVCIEYPADRRQPVLRRAVEIARRSGARLTLFHSTFSQLSVGPGFQSPAVRDDVQQKLASAGKAMEAMATRLRRQGLNVEVKTAWDYPAYEAIVREVLRGEPDLVVAGSQRRVFGARLFLTNTDWQLIRLCPVPLLFVKKQRAYGRARVLAAIDPLHPQGRATQLDRRILEAAQAMAQIFRGRMDVVYAALPLYTHMPDFYGQSAAPLEAEVEVQYAQAAKQAVQRATAGAGLPARQVHMESGAPQLVIAARARRMQADVVVMGAISRSALGRLFIGSTAEGVLDRLACDVLVIKPRAFKTAVARRAPAAQFHPAPA